MSAKTIRNIIYRGFYILFAVVFGYIALNVLLKDNIHSYKTADLLRWIVIGAIVVIGVFIGICRVNEKKLDKYYRYILAGFSVVYFIVLLRIGFILRFTPSFDMDAIYSGAIQWTSEGNFSNFYEYFGYFPNNLGSMGFLHVIFSIASWFGIKDYFAVGIFVNSVLIAATAVTVSLVCRKISGSRVALMSLVLFLICLPFYFMSAAFYTDSLSMLFPVLFYYLYLCYKESEKNKSRVIYLAFMGISLTIGMMIKFTVVIVLIAVIIDAALSLPWKKVLLILAVSLMFYGASTSIYNHNIYKNYISDEQYQNLKTPYWHWIMMGLQNNGYYSPEDYEYTRSYPVDERSGACRKKALERVKELGFSGLFKLWTNKAIVCFGDGTYALSDFLDDTPANETGIHDYVLYAGKYYAKYQHASTGILILLYLLAICGAIKDIIGKFKNEEERSKLAPRLAMLGIVCFLLIWETSGRYFTNYVPVLIICASLSLAWKGGKKS